MRKSARVSWGGERVMGRIFGIWALIAIPGTGAAFECSFDKECYEAEVCGKSAFTLAVDIKAKKITSDVGDLIIVAVKEARGLKTMFATGQGAEYLLSLTPKAARLSAQSNDGPQVITYLGICKGAF